MVNIVVRLSIIRLMMEQGAKGKIILTQQITVHLIRLPYYNKSLVLRLSMSPMKEIGINCLLSNMLIDTVKKLE